MIRAMSRSFGIAALAAVSLMLAACQAGHTRGMFSGNVIGKTQAEIVEKYGPPAAIDDSNAGYAVLVYKAKTFDPDNANRPDPETAVYLVKDKDGRLVANDVSYRG